MNKKDLSERDICSKFIGPAVKRAGWDGMMQIREEVNFTKGRIIVRGKLVTRGKAKRADYILYYKPNIPIAIIEAKDNNHSVGDGMQQALDYAVTLNIPFVFSSNGDGFVFHDRTGMSMEKEATLSLDAFPSPKDLWSRYRTWKELTPDEEAIVLQDYFDDGSGKAPRYYQTNAINAAIEAIAKGQNRTTVEVGKWVADGELKVMDTSVTDRSFETTAAVLLVMVGGWLWVQGRHSVETTDTAVLDLRERSVARGQGQSETGHAPLEIPRTAKHLILDLPIGSKEGPYEVGLISERGDQILRATGIAQLHDHITDLRVGIDLSNVRVGAYSLGVRQPGLEWTRYPTRVF